MLRSFLMCLCLAGIAQAGQFNEVLSIGDAAPAWKDLPGTDGKSHSLDDLKEIPVVVVVFTCNSCPVASAYEDRIISLSRHFSGKVQVVAMNVNRIPEDSLEKMQERAAASQFPYPYLYDETQQIARNYGAVFTPEFFVLDSARTIAYMGGMDDNSDPASVTRNDLIPAIEAVLNHKPPLVKETLGRGCRIRYARQRPAAARSPVREFPIGDDEKRFCELPEASRLSRHDVPPGLKTEPGRRTAALERLVMGIATEFAPSLW